MFYGVFFFGLVGVNMHNSLIDLILSQQIADESQVRIELQMALDSKDSDIEQLRSQLQLIHVGLDTTSIGSGPGDAEVDDGFPGTYGLLPEINKKHVLVINFENVVIFQQNY